MEWVEGGVRQMTAKETLMSSVPVAVHQKDILQHMTRAKPPPSSNHGNLFADVEKIKKNFLSIKFHFIP